ncbi:MAG: transcriptional antiterminator, Rof [Gammaproteobacteria bacterium]|nr:transcriptional antiterminator, Rof [Gammaproteobacteria bacterium]
MSVPAYTPVDCTTYALFELAILKGEGLRMRWRSRLQQAHVATLFPENLRTRWHSEFLIARDYQGKRYVLRLDRIQRIQEL